MDFWSLYDLQYDKVRRFILAMVKSEADADDLVQETFIRVQNNLESLKDPSRASAWIFRIAYNLCLDHFRRQKAAPTLTEIDPDEREAFDHSMQKEAERRRMSACVQDKIDKLPEESRTILLLCDRMEFSHKEAAEILGVESGAARVRLHRARKRLKEILETECDFERDERDVMVCDPKNAGRSEENPGESIIAKGAKEDECG